jgi:Putative restriction endonuclease
VGPMENEPGWAPSAPPLAVEIADRGQDEADLQEKIQQLLAAGTRYLWVVRLTGIRRVEVYEPGKSKRSYMLGQELRAPGVLQNPVLVDAFFKQEVAWDLTLRNLLQRQGYRNLDAVREEGIEQGTSLLLLRQICRRLGRSLTAAEQEELRHRLATLGPESLGDVVLDLDAAALEAWLSTPQQREPEAF